MPLIVLQNDKDASLDEIRTDSVHGMISLFLTWD